MPCDWRSGQSDSRGGRKKEVALGIWPSALMMSRRSWSGAACSHACTQVCRRIFVTSSDDVIEERRFEAPTAQSHHVPEPTTSLFPLRECCKLIARERRRHCTRNPLQGVDVPTRRLGRFAHRCVVLVSLLHAHVLFVVQRHHRRRVRFKICGIRECDNSYNRPLIARWGVPPHSEAVPGGGPLIAR